MESTPDSMDLSRKYATTSTLTDNRTGNRNWLDYYKHNLLRCYHKMLTKRFYHNSKDLY